MCDETRFGDGKYCETRELVVIRENGVTSFRNSVGVCIGAI